MTEINRDLLQVLRQEMNAALLAVAQKHGVSINVGNASFNVNDATFKLHVLQNGTTVQDKKKEEQANKLAAYKGLFPEIDFDASYKALSIPGHNFKITGYNSRAYKAPFLITSESDPKKVYKVSLEYVKHILVKA